MDPDANLTEQLQLVTELIECSDREHDGPCECQDNGARLAELVQALHGWIRSGGFLPKAWRKEG